MTQLKNNIAMYCSRLEIYVMQLTVAVDTAEMILYRQTGRGDFRPKWQMKYKHGTKNFFKKCLLPEIFQSGLFQHWKRFLFTPAHARVCACMCACVCVRENKNGLLKYYSYFVFRNKSVFIIFFVLFTICFAQFLSNKRYLILYTLSTCLLLNKQIFYWHKKYSAIRYCFIFYSVCYILTWHVKVLVENPNLYHLCSLLTLTVFLFLKVFSSWLSAYGVLNKNTLILCCTCYLLCKYCALTLCWSKHISLKQKVFHNLLLLYLILSRYLLHF